MKNNITSIGAACASRSAVIHWRPLAALAALLVAVPVSAQRSPDDVAVSLLARKVLVADGREKLVTAERALPGEVIQYDARYRNQSKGTVRQLAPTLPIPAGMVFVPDSATPAPAQASLDGKTFAPLPLKRRITRPDGQVVEEEIPATEIRAVRWQVGDLAAGGTTNVIARVRLAQR